MDLSKLPRLSKTDAPPPGPEPAGADAGADAASGAPAPPGGFEPVMPGSVPTSAAAVGYCQCGAPVRAGARFCDSCGAAVAGAAVAAPAQRDFYAPRDAGVGAEVWLSAIIGAFLMLMGKSFGGWLLATLTGQTYNTGVVWSDDNDKGIPGGQMVAYWDLDGYAALTDSAIFLFGLAMVLEAVVLALMNTRFRHKAALITVALLVTVVATAYNLFVAVKLLSVGGTPLWSLLAVAFGGYIAIFEWRLLQQFRAAPRTA